MKKHKVGLWMYTNEFGYRPRQEVIDALEKEGYEVIYDFDMRECYVFNGHVFTKDSINLSQLDVLYYMNVDERNHYQDEILHFLELSGVKMINGVTSYYNASDKALTSMILTQNDIKTPPSILIPNQFQTNVLEDIFEEWGSVVLKNRKGSGGKGIIKFDSYDAFKDFYEYVEGSFDNFYLEKFIEFTDRDYRIGLLNGEVIEAYSRSRASNFKTNIHSGCNKVYPIENPETFIALAKKAAKAIGITATIIDMVTSTVDHEIYVLEVNENMGFFLEAHHDYLRSENVNLEIGNIKNDKAKIKALVNYINTSLGNV